MKADFKHRWLTRFGLSPANWRKKASAHLAQLPFTELHRTRPLVEALFGCVPELLSKHDDELTPLLAEAYAWTCFSLWQCGSAFPTFPENYAAFLKAELFKPRHRRLPEAGLVARMIVEFNARDEQCGFNKLGLADAGAVRDSERRMLDGSYEFYLKTQEKYDEYQFYLKELPDFQKEWRAIKRAFPKPTNTKQIIHRTLLPERNWERGAGAQFGTLAERFQASFDLFCWKYFLWGMHGDEPLLMKPSAVFTPLGTQIFIPGYLSLDAKRDLDFGRIGQIHKARGLARQGEGFSVGRQKTEQLKLKAKGFDAAARAMNLKADARYNFIARKLGLPIQTDPRYIRRLLQFTNPTPGI